MLFSRFTLPPVVVRSLWWIWAAGVLWGSLRSPAKLAETFPAWLLSLDKLQHFTAYFLGTVLAYHAGRLEYYSFRVGAVLLISLSIEVLQRLTPDRTFDLMDIAANCTGIALGLAWNWKVNNAVFLKKET